MLFENRTMLSIENVIQKKLGYLKVPQAFRDVFGSPIYWPEPVNVSTCEDSGKVFLIYEFSKEQMNKIKKQSR
jgi:hypothetical protein